MEDAVLAIESAGFRFSDGRRALDDVSFAVRRGDNVGIIGPNGAGKTTLFLALIGIRRIDRGNIRVMGLDVRHKQSLNDIRRQVGMVFQNPDDQLFSASVYDDVAFGPLHLGINGEPVDTIVAKALEETGMAGSQHRVSHHLSAGEKRRVALATVLACDPQILVLDEPTNDLDPQGRRQIISLIAQLERTRLIASHDLELIRSTCQRVILLDGGRLITDGPADDVMGNAELMNKHGLEVPWSLRT